MAAVLFTDLVGSTELLSRLGEAAFDEMRRAHFSALARALDQSGGEQVKGTGDGVLAVFGSAAAAVNCAMAIQQAVDLQGRTSVPLAVRVGIALGDVSFEDGDVHGTPVVEAARLVAAAQGGQILSTTMVRGVAGGRSAAVFTDVGSLELKGLPVPVATCEIAWEPLPLASLPLPALPTDIGQIFVGRDAELEQLGRLWTEALTADRRVVLIAGEPGVGKTRLAAELARQVHGGGAAVLAGRCDEDLGVPYQPFVEALRQFVVHAPDLSARVGRYGGDLARLVPELEDRIRGLPSPIRSDPETERYRLFDAVTDWLRAASTREPLLLVLDDLQWAAKPTLLLLRHVVRAADLSRVLVLGTYRDTELTHDHPLVEVMPDLRRQGGVERLSLSGLDEAGVAAIVEQAAGATLDERGRALSRAIRDETEGNPFFVREVLRHLAETGAVEWREGGWTTQLPVEELGIPEGVRDVVGRRLARLSRDTHQALRVGAVVGAEFELRLVQVAESIGEEAFLAALDEAARARLVIEASASRYRFSHALVRATLYEELSAARRVSLHRRVAEAIETCHAGALDDHLPALAHHWAKASAPTADTARAVDYARRAGDRALAQLANDEAVSFYSQALELLQASEGVPDGGERLELLIALGEAQRRAGDAAHRETLLAAASFARERADADALARAALANHRAGLMSAVGDVDEERVAALEAALELAASVRPTTRARLLANLGIERIFMFDREHRTALSDEALVLARQAGDAATLAHVLTARFLTIYGPDTLQERLAMMDELLELAPACDDPVVRFAAHWLQHGALIEMGEMDSALDHLDRAEGVATDLGQPSLRWLAKLSRVGVALMAGRIDDAERLSEQTFALGQSSGQADAAVFFLSQQWRIRLEQARLDEVEPLLVAARAGLPRFKSSLGALLLQTYAEVGRPDDAQALLVELSADSFHLPRDPTWLIAMMAISEGLRYLDDAPGAALIYEFLFPYAPLFATGGGVSLGCTAYYLGILASTMGRFDDAEHHLAYVAEVYQRVGAPALLGRTQVEWARTLLARRGPGDAARARELLDQALSTARQLGLVAVERRAVALLAEVT